MITIDSWNLPPTWLLWTVDTVLAIVVLEGAVLVAWLHRQGRPIGAIGSALVAGAGLAGALRISLHQGPDLAVLACLALAGAAHAWEVLSWLRPRPSATRRAAIEPERSMAWPQR